MKSLLKRAIGKAVRNEFLWSVLDFIFIRFARYVEKERNRFTQPQAEEPKVDIDAAIVVVSPDLTVRHGAFRGMKYPGMKSVGSMLFPKILGSYERELQPLMERIVAKGYTEIVDIGCAEGYYAVGLGIAIPQAKVFAFDTDKEAIELCRKMARINHISDRLFTGDFCDPAMLKSIPLTKRALIISDCEGYEKTLFNKELIPFLANHDVLIEVHDLIDITLSSYLWDLFKETHCIEVIESIDDIKKARTYQYAELEGFSLAERKILLREWRSSIMDWFYMTPLQQIGGKSGSGDSPHG